MSSISLTGFRRLLLLVFILLLLCACAAENPEIDEKEKAVGDAGNEEISPSQSNEAMSSVSNETVGKVDTSSPVIKPNNGETARTNEKAPVLWRKCSSNIEVQDKYDIIQESSCKSNIIWIHSYNQQISRVLYEYLQKNEPGKENRLVEHYNEWYSKATEKLQQIDKDKRKEYFNELSIEYIKHITAEIEGKFQNACAYAQYLFTHAKYMFHFFPSTQYRRQIDGVAYGFIEYGLNCLTYHAYPIDKERSYQNAQIISLDGKRDLYYEKCVQGFEFEYNNRLYRLNINGIDEERYPGAKQVLYELEKDKLNFKSVCEIK